MGAMDKIQTFFRRGFGAAGPMAASLLVWLLSFAFLMIIVAQIILWGGLYWASSTAQGRDFVEKRLEDVLANQGLNLDIEKLHLDGLNRLRVGAFTLADDQGVLLSGRDLKIRIGILPLAAKKLNLNFSAQQLRIVRLPEAEKSKINDAAFLPIKIELPSVTLPDLFFKKLDIQNFAIEDLYLGQGVISPSAMSFSPQMRLLWDQSDRRDAVFMLNFDNKKAAALIPDRARILINFRQKSRDIYELEIDHFEIIHETIQSQAYNITMAGLFARQSDGLVAFDFQALMQGALLQNHKFEPVSITAQTQQIDGQQANILLQGATSFQGKPMTLLMNTYLNSHVLRVEELLFNAPQSQIKAAGQYDYKTQLVQGGIKGEISLSPYRSLLSGVTGDVVLDIDLQAFDYQEIAADISVHKAQWNDYDFETIKLTLKTQKQNQHFLSFDVNGKTVSQNIQLSATGQARAHLENQHLIALDDADINLALSQNRQERGTAHIKGGFDLQDVDIAARLNRVHIPSVMAVVGTEAVGLTDYLVANAQMKLHGRMDNPIANINLSFEPIRVRQNVQPLNLSFRADYESGRFWGHSQVTGEGVTKWENEFSAAIDFALNPWLFSLDENTDITASLRSQINAASWAPLLLPPTMQAAGQFKSDIDVTGTIVQPYITGQLAWENGMFRDIETGLDFKSMNLRADFAGQAIEIREFKAEDSQGGTVEMTGRVDLQTDVMPIDIKLMARRLNPYRGTNLADGLVSADLQLMGDMRNLYDAKGRIDVHPTYITLPSRFASSIPRLNIIQPDRIEQDDFLDRFLQKIRLAITVDAPQQIFVRGWGLDAEFGGQVDVSGTADTPLLTGDLSSRRGRYEEFGRRFRIERAVMRFQGEVPPSPYLDIVARIRVDDVEADVILSGSAMNPTLGFASQPSMPEDEILSFILFGRDMSALSPFQAIQLAQTLRRFSGQGGDGFDPLGLVREATGLDDLRYDMDESGGGTIGLGKYLTDKVYLELQSGTGESSGGARLEIELTPSVSVESELGQDSRTGGRVFWKWNY